MINQFDCSQENHVYRRKSKQLEIICVIINENDYYYKISYFRPIYKIPSYFNTREGILCFRFICISLELPGSFLERVLY